MLMPREATQDIRQVDALRDGLARRRAELAAVFLAAFLAFSFGLWDSGIASGWIDPVLRLGAQDESVYTHEAIGMVTRGGWMTPMLSGRYSFEKPPLLMWLSALSMKVFGIGRFTARLPAVLAGALAAMLVFAVVRAARSSLAGAAAALLVISNQLLFTLSRHNMTDILLAAAVLGALVAQALDTSLSGRRSQIAFTLAVTAGILTKSLAGLLPVAAAFLFACVSTKHRRLRLRRTALLSCLALLAASPWFLYHLAVHREWLLADLAFQIFTVGVNPHQTSPEHHVWFYIVRLLYSSPVAVGLGISGVVVWAAALRRCDDIVTLLTCYLAVLAGSLLAFRFHSQQYLTPLIPVIILIAAVCSPLLNRRVAAPVLAVIAAAFLIKTANPERAWGISYRPGNTVTAARALSSYCSERRGNDLFIMGVSDEFYALSLPLKRVRYGWIDPSGIASKTRPHLFYLGVVQDVRLPGETAVYASRLRSWGLDSTEPLGSGLVARTAEELAAIIPRHGHADFLISKEIVERMPSLSTHEIRRVGPGYVFLYSREPAQAHAPGWTCAM